jgi:hypothetical protein
MSIDEVQTLSTVVTADQQHWESVVSIAVLSYLL